MNISTIRTKWAAVGAAVAVTLGAGGIGISHATTSSGERAIYQPIEPCRAADLRPAPDQVGPRSAPLGPNETYTLSGWGAVGDCNLPTGTTALALNVTALGATEQTFLTIYPGAGTPPNASSLNPAPGQPPVPNAVNVDLDDAGMYSIFNKFGNVNVIVDVVGIYDDHNHDDRYYAKDETYTQAEVDALTVRNPVAVATSTAAFAYDETNQSTWQEVISTSVTVPAGFTATLEATFGGESTCFGTIDDYCSVRILANAAPMAPAENTNNAFDSTDGGTRTASDYQETSIMRTSSVPAGTYTITVEAYTFGGDIDMRLDDLILFVKGHLSPA